MANAKDTSSAHNQPSKPKVIAKKTGQQVKLVDPADSSRSVTFTVGGSKRHVIEDGFVFVNAQVRFADGTQAYAVLEIDEDSSGELWGMGIFLADGGMTWQDDGDFFKKLDKQKEHVFPYRYRIDAAVHCCNHHIGADGWSI